MRLPLATVPPWRRRARYLLTRLVVGAACRLLFRLEVDGSKNASQGPAMYCFNHLSWADPFLVMAVLPTRPKLYFFGPREEDMSVGARNRLMIWSGLAVPFRPGKEDLLETARRVRAVFDSGSAMAIAGEGRIHVHEGDLLPLQEGTAYFALRSGIPIIPVAVNGTSVLTWRGRIQVRIGEPIRTEGRPTREAVESYTRRTWLALQALVAESRDRPRPRGPFGRWLTDLFNDWGPDGRAGADAVRGPRREDVEATESNPGVRPGSRREAKATSATSTTSRESVLAR